jgi:hypothetical protein
MAQVVGWDGDTRLLLFTRSAAPGAERPMVHYGRILDLSTMRVWPEVYLASIIAHTGPWEPLNDPIPADRLLALARVQPLR